MLAQFYNCPTCQSSVNVPQLGREQPENWGDKENGELNFAHNFESQLLVFICRKEQFYILDFKRSGANK